MNSRTLASVNSTLATPMTRRSALRAFATVGLAMATIGSLGQASAQISAQQHTSQLYTVSTSANFRTGPSTSYAIISVISKGSTFTLNGQSQNGYAGITYQSRNGWVLASLVVPAGSVGSNPVLSGEAWTIAAVNLRSGPGATYQVLRVVRSDSKIAVSNTVKNGFRYVSHQGLAGWVFDAYISFTNGGSQPGDDQGGNYKTTTTALNLRAEPSTSAKILTVMPAGARVQVLHTQASGFVNVNYNGMQGWAAIQYLK